MKINSCKYLFVIFFFQLPFYGHSFGVLTHEAIIDAAWDKSILPLLKSRYPGATADDLKTAHAYAYGGAVTPDMGYYPFGSTLFTNLVHYVRSGDMVNSLLKNANNLNEYAFAIGFLSHYNADNYGHPLATNRSVTLVYPNLRKKYGSVVTYAQHKISHLRMEFGFDVLQISNGNYASTAYHDLIGFKVDTSVLARAFLETYGLDINEVFSNHLPLTVEVFRFLVANIFPFITRTAWASKKSDIIKKDSTATSKSFRYRMRVRQYNKQFGKHYKRPGTFPTILSFIIKILPKVGALRPLKFKVPTAQAEKYFAESFDTIIQNYTANLKQLSQPNITLKDKDFDTGNPTAPCEYSLADQTYDRWLLKLNKNNFKNVTVPIKQNITNFYAGSSSLQKKKYPKRCNEVFNAVTGIRTVKGDY